MYRARIRVPATWTMTTSSAVEERLAGRISLAPNGKRIDNAADSYTISYRSVLVLLEVAREDRFALWKVREELADLRKRYGVGIVGIHHVEEPRCQFLRVFAHSLQQFIELLLVEDAVTFLIDPAEKLHQRFQVLFVTAELVVEHALHKRLVADALSLVLVLEGTLLLAGEHASASSCLRFMWLQRINEFELVDEVVGVFLVVHVLDYVLALLSSYEVRHLLLHQIVEFVGGLQRMPCSHVHLQQVEDA